MLNVEKLGNIYKQQIKDSEFTCLRFHMLSVIGKSVLCGYVECVCLCGYVEWVCTCGYTCVGISVWVCLCGYVEWV